MTGPVYVLFALQGWVCRPLASLDWCTSERGVSSPMKYSFRRLALALLCVWVGVWLLATPHLVPAIESSLSARSLSPAVGKTHTLKDLDTPGRSDPTLQHETARRRVAETTTELWYFLHARLKALKATFSGSANLRRVLDELQEDLQGYQKTMLRDLQNLRHVAQDEEWRTSESSRLGDLVQRRLDFLQSPPDCSKARLLECKRSATCVTGFSCHLHHVTFCLVVAYATRRTLVLAGGALPGEHAFLLPLTTCRAPAGEPRVTWSASPKEMESARILQLSGLAETEGKDVRPDFLPPAIPQDLAPSLMALHERPHVWWYGQILRYVTRPNMALLRHINDTKFKLGFRTPVVGVHIRRSDKKSEAVYHDLEEYMGHVDTYFRQSTNVTGRERRVFLATDDPELLQEARKRYSDYTIFSNNNASKIAASVKFRLKEEALRGILTDIILLSQADFIVCTFSSNVGRAAYTLMQTRHGDASNGARSLDDGFYIHGSNPALHVAVEEHVPRDVTQLSFRAGDRLRVHGNHWDGLSLGTNERSGQKGLFPSYKAQAVVKVAAMPVYPDVER